MVDKQKAEINQNDTVKYTYVTICRDIDKNGNITPSYVSDGTLVLFDSEIEAYDSAYDAACKEAEELCEGADEEISFGEVETDTCITVNYYYHPDNNTEWVTKRIVRPVKV